MSDFHVEVCRILKVEEHPNADRLTLNQVKGYIAISNKLENGEARYKEGDLVVYILEAAVLPEWILKSMEFWDKENNKGTLSGKDGNRVKAIRLRGIFSQGILFPVVKEPVGCYARDIIVNNETNKTLFVEEGFDVAEFLGITKYQPPVPAALAGEVCNLFGKPMKYDFENWQSVPDIFDEGEEVFATEKVHGSCLQLGYIPKLNHPELFFDGNLFVGSKGLSGQGLVFKNNENNDGNLYVKVLRKLLSNGFGERLKKYSSWCGESSIYIFGEVFGPGVQDLHYGLKEPEFRVFDIAFDGVFADYEDFLIVAEELELPIVPILYHGPFDEDVLRTHRDGKTTFDGANIREGIVIKTVQENRHLIHGRKISKMVSPDYLLRKAKKGEEITEYQ